MHTRNSAAHPHPETPAGAGEGSSSGGLASEALHLQASLVAHTPPNSHSHSHSHSHYYHDLLKQQQQQQSYYPSPAHPNPPTISRTSTPVSTLHALYQSGASHANLTPSPSIGLRAAHPATAKTTTSTSRRPSLAAGPALSIRKKSSRASPYDLKSYRDVNSAAADIDGYDTSDMSDSGGGRGGQDGMDEVGLPGEAAGSFYFPDPEGGVGGASLVTDQHDHLTYLNSVQPYSAQHKQAHGSTNPSQLANPSAPYIAQQHLAMHPESSPAGTLPITNNTVPLLPSAADDSFQQQQQQQHGSGITIAAPQTVPTASGSSDLPSWTRSSTGPVGDLSSVALYSHSRSSSISSISSQNTASSSSASVWSDIETSQHQIGADGFHHSQKQQQHLQALQRQYQLQRQRQQQQQQSGTTIIASTSSSSVQRNTRAAGKADAAAAAAKVMEEEYPPQTEPNLVPFARAVKLALAGGQLGHAGVITMGTANASSTEKAKINFIHAWLTHSFQLHPEGNVSRHALYASYIQICHDYGLVPINAASYGKAVRSCWPGIKTRRLGVRGQSKYHYCGIRPANRRTEDLVAMANANEAAAESGAAGSSHGASGVGFANATGSESNSSTDSSNVSSNLESSFTSMSTNDSPDKFMANAVALYPPGQSRRHVVDAPGNQLVELQQQQQQQHQQATLVSVDGVDPHSTIHYSPGEMSLGPASTSAGVTNGSTSTIARTGSSPLEQHHLAASSSSYFGNVQPTGLFAPAPPPPGGPRQSFGSSSTSPVAPEGGAHTVIVADSSLRRQSSVSSLHYSPSLDTVPTDPSYCYTLSTEPSEAVLQDAHHVPPADHVIEPHFGSGPAARAQESQPDEEEDDSDIIPDFNMSDLKTPTALQFFSKSASFSSTPQADGAGSQPLSAPVRPPLLTTTSSSSLESRRKGSDSNLGTGSRSSAGSDCSNKDSFSIRSKGRRATAPDLSIHIPPLPKSKPPSPLLQLESTTSAAEVPCAAEVGSASAEDHIQVVHLQPATEQQTSVTFDSSMLPPTLAINLPTYDELLHQFHQNTSNLGDLPFDALSLTNDSAFDKHGAELLWSTYRSEHCLGIIKVAAADRWEEIGAAMMLFWTQMDDPQQQRLAQHPLLNEAMYRADSALYDAILTHLNSSILSQRGAMQNDGTSQQLGELATKLEQCIVGALHQYPPDFVGCRVELASRAAHLINRHLGIVQLGQALGRILTDPYNITTMLAAWESVDFDSVSNQAALVTNSTHETVEQYQDSVRSLLEQVRNAMDVKPSMSGNNDVDESAASQCMAVLRLVVAFANEALEGSARFTQELVAGGQGTVLSSIDMGPRSFLLKWNYIAGQVLRDLTIKSHASFGNFQILSLFVEEWLAFKVLKQVSLHVHAVQASVAVEESGERVDSSNDNAHHQHSQIMGDASLYLVSPHPLAALARSHQSLSGSVAPGSGSGSNGTSPTNNDGSLKTSSSPPSRSNSGTVENTTGVNGQAPSSATEAGQVPNAVGEMSFLAPHNAHGFAHPSSMVNLNITTALSPTTRAIFGEAKTPLFLNFNTHHLQPMTPTLFSNHHVDPPHHSNFSEMTDGHHHHHHRHSPQQYLHPQIHAQTYMQISPRFRTFPPNAFAPPPLPPTQQQPFAGAVATSHSSHHESHHHHHHQPHHHPPSTASAFATSFEDFNLPMPSPARQAQLHHQQPQPQQQQQQQEFLH